MSGTDWWSAAGRFPLSRIAAGPQVPEVTLGGTREDAIRLIGATLEVRDMLGVNGDYEITDVQPAGGEEGGGGWNLSLRALPQHDMGHQ